jgi:autotransporter-associated beta strand protein
MASHRSARRRRKCARKPFSIDQHYWHPAIEWLEPRWMLASNNDVDGPTQVSAPATPTDQLVAVPYPATTNSQQSYPTYVTFDRSGTSTPFTSSGPVGYTATQILDAYGVNQLVVNGAQPTGTGETIAIIDAYNDPNITADLQTFDTAMGLPAPPSFTVVSQTGSTTTLPANDTTGWAVEESLDVEWAHTMAPGANIMLVEANSNFNNDLETAISYAESVPSVAVISMSYGSSESSGESGGDSLYTTPAGHSGITFVASTGDYGSPGEYPAYSPNVVAVGGTSLYLSGSSYSSESGWSGSGGGISQYETQPSYQNGVVTQSSTQRTIPDVSFDADPNTGPAIIDSWTYGSADPWTQIGGTSFSAPSWAAIITLADQVRVSDGLGNMDGFTQTLPALYELPATDFHDVTSGNNGGFSAGPGYDLVTGRGTPLVNQLVPDLSGYSLYVTSTTPSSGSVVATPPTSFTVNFNAAIDPSSIALSDFSVDSQSPTSFTSTSTSITFNYGISPVTTVGLQTMDLSGITELSDENAMAPLAETFRYDPHPITVSATSPAANSLVTLPMTTVQVTFSEPYGASSISDSNLQLSTGTVTGYTLNNSTTVTYTISGVSYEGTTGRLTVSLPVGAVTDTAGDPNQTAFSANFTLHAVMVPLPPLTAAGPAGSLIDDSQLTGALGAVGQTDSYTLSLNAGETISVVATASGGLEPAIGVQGPGAFNASASSTAPNLAAVLEPVTITTSGSYTFLISGLANTLGGYTLEAYVNAAVESELYGGPSNSTLATAQNLASSFVSLGGAGSRGAVLGALGSSSDQDWYSFTLNSGDMVTIGAAASSGSSVALALRDGAGDLLVSGSAASGSFQQQISNFTAAAAGTYYVQVTGSGASQYSLTLVRNADFDNQSNNSLASAQPLSPSSGGGTQVVLGTIGHATGSLSGLSTIESFDSASELSNYTITTTSTASILSAAAHNGSSGLSTGANTDWIYRDDSTVQVSQGETMSVWVESAGAASGRAYFGFGASAAGALSIVMAGNSGQLQLQDNTGYGGNFTVIGTTNQTWLPNHWYLLQVVWGAGGQITGNLYDSNGSTLLNTVSGTDDNITSGGIAFRGFGNPVYFDTVGVSPPQTPTYALQATAGSTLSASTTTPGDGGVGINTLDPRLLIYNSAGVLVASDDNSGADGRNAVVSYVVPAGAGGTYYIQVADSPLTSQPTYGDYVLTVQGSSINNAPTLNTSVAPALPSVLGGSGGGAGDLVSSILATMAGGNPISDSDPGALQGIAVSAADSSDGAWQYSTNGGGTWNAFSQVSTTSALLLTTSDRIRYVPAPGFGGIVPDALSFHAWDQTEGNNGGTFDISISGGATAFSTAFATASLTVIPVNTAPVLTGANALAAQLENNSASAGTLVSALLAGRIIDPDSGAVQGIAVTAANTANGSWQYSTSGSAGPWLALGSVSSTNARVLAANASTLVRFVPNSGYSGTVTAALTFRAWDQTDGLANGSLVNPGAGGGSSAYSTASASAGLTVAPLGETRSWIGGGPDNNWSDGANWVGGVAPSANDNLIFPTAALTYLSVDDFAAGTQFRSVTIAGSSYSITGNGVTLLEGLVDSANGPDGFTAPLTLAAAQTIINGNANSTLTLGSIDTGLLQTLTFDGSGTTSVTGIISDSGGLTKNGSGTLILSGPNTYLGLTSIVQGVLLAENNSALGSASAGTNVTIGAALQVSGGVTIAEPLTISGNGIGVGTPGGALPISGLGALRSIGGGNTWTGSIDMNGTGYIGVDAGSELNVSGSVSGLFAPTTTALEKVGAGQLDLAGTSPNQINGTTTVLQGTLLLDKSGGTAIQGGLTIGDNIEGNDASVVRLGASNQILQVDPTGGTLLSVTVNSAGLLDLNGFNDTIGSLTLVTGQTYSANITTGSGMLTLGGNLTVTGAEGTTGQSPAATISGFLDLGSLSGFSGGSTNTTRTFTINDTSRLSMASDLTISAVISGSSAISLTRAGAGTLTLTGANTYAGTTLLTAGLTEIGNSTAFGSGTVVISAAQLDAVGGAQTVANSIEIGGAAEFWGSNNLTFSGPTTLTASRNFYVLNPAQTVTFSSGIGEGVFNGSSLSKFGPGTLALTGINSYSGQTIIGVGGGTLDLGASGTLLNNSNITIDDQATFKLDNATTYIANRISPLATITLAGGTLDFVGAANTASSESIGAVTLSAGHTSTIESDQAGGGTAMLTLASLSTAAGATVSFIGTGSALSATGSNQILVAISPGSLTNGILPYATVTGPSSLDLATYMSNAAGVAITALPAADYVTSLSAAGPTSNVKLSSPGSYTANGATINALLISGTGITVGGINDSLTVSSGAVVFTGDGTNTLSVGRLNLGSQAFITADSGSTATISGVVTGAGTSLTKAGSGTVVLSGANQFSGSDYIDQGILNIQNSAALGATSSTVTVNQGATLALQDPGGSPVNVGPMALTLWGFGLNNVGALENISGNSNSWAGTIALDNVSIDSTTVISNWGSSLMAATFIGSAAGQLSLTGAISGSAALVKLGAGTVALGGVLSNTFSGSTLVEQGTLLLNKATGLNSLGPTGDTIYIGNDVTSAQLELGANNQLLDTTAVVVNSTGTLNFNGFSDAVGALTLTIGPNGSSLVETGSGTLTLGGSVLVQGLGTGNPAPATISGNLALNPFTATAAVTRTFTVNDGAAGDDLVISAAIRDGNGVFSGGITKFGLGTMQFTGSSANTYTGTTTISEGTLELNKSPGVNALTGPLTIGEGSLGAGGADSQVVRLLASNQINGALAVVVNSTGLLDLNGFSDTIGTGPDVAALTINGGNVTTGSGTLTLDGDVTETAVSSNNIVNPGTISGNLNLGAAARTFSINHLAALPYDLIVSANISGAAGADLNKTGLGTLLLSGNNTYAGNTYLSASSPGEIAVGSDTALGTGTLFLSGSTLLSDSGPHVISNTVYMSGITFAGANSLTLSGPANLTASIVITVTNAMPVTFSGGIGETQNNDGIAKFGSGFLYLTGQNTYDGITSVSGGWLVLDGPGTAINSSSFQVNANATLRIDNNSAGNLADRISGNATITVNGGTLLYIGASGAASSETIGQLTIGASASSTVISQPGAGSGSSVALTFGQLNRIQFGAVRFVGAGTSLGAANQILFTTAPTETGSGTNAILPYATVVSSAGQVDLATLSGSSNQLLAFTNYATGNINNVPSGSVYLLDGNSSTSPQTLTQVQSLNAVLIRGSGLVLTGNAGQPLALTSGTLVSAGTGANTLSVSTLDFGTAEGIITTDADLTISSRIIGGSAVGITKAGPAALTLSGTSPNTYTGQTIITQGVLNAQKSGALGAGGAASTVQTVTIGNAIGGSFELYFNGQETAAIAYNASAATVATDLDALTTIGGIGGSVTVTDPNPSANPNVYTITFGGSQAGIAQPGFGFGYSLSYNVVLPTFTIATLNSGGLIGAGTTVVSGAALQLSNSSTETGEQLTLNGTGLASTGALHGDGSNNAWNGPVVVSSATIVNVDSGGQLAIGDAISGTATFTKFGTGTLQFAGVNPNTLTGTTIVDDGTLLLNKTAGVTAINGALTIGNDIGPGSDVVQVETAEQISGGSVTVSSTGVLQLLSNVATSTTQAEQTVTVAGSSGSFTLTFSGQTTANIPFNATPATVQADLDSLSTIGGAGGSVSVTGTPGAYVVLFGGSLVDHAQAQMSIAIVSGSSISTDTVKVISNGGALGSQTIAALTTQVGIAASSSVLLASGTTLAFSGILTTNSGVAGASSASPSITISGGNLALGTQGVSGTRTITVNDSPAWVDVSITSTITNAIGGGASGFIKAGAGRLVLDPTSDSNSFSGAVTVSAGELNLQQAGALGIAATTNVSSGAVLELQGASILTSVPLTLNGTATINASGGMLLNVSGNNTWAGNVLVIGAGSVTGASTVGVAAGTSLTLSGVISGSGISGDLTKILPGTLVFSGSSANTDTGTTTVNEGTLLLSKSAGVDAIAAAGSLTVGNDAGGSDSDLVQLTAASEIDPAASVTINSTGQLDLDGFNQTLAGVTMEFGPTQSAALTTESGTLSLTGSATFNSVGTLYSGSPAATISGNLALGSTTHTFTVNSGVSLDNAQISATITGTGTVTKSGIGTLLLSTNNAAGWSSPITLSGGTVALGNSGGLGTGTLTVIGTTALRGEGTGVTLPNNITLSAGLTIAGTQSFALSDTISPTASNYTVSVTSTGPTSIGTVALSTFMLNLSTNFYSNVTLTAVTGQTLNKIGAGRLTVAPTGSVAPSTLLIQGGVLAVSTASSLGAAFVEPETGGALEISGTQTFTNNTLILFNTATANTGGNNFLTGALRSTSGNNTWSGSVILMGSPAAGVAYIGVDAGQLTMTGAISESISGSGLAKVGAGTLVLGGSASNTFTGLTTVDQGTLQLNKSGSANAIGSGGVTVGDGGGGHDADVLQFGPATGSAEIPNTSAETVTVGSSGELNLANYSANATISNLVLDTAPVSSADVQTGSAMLTVGQNENLTVISSGATDGSSPAATISGNLSLGAWAFFTVNPALVPSTAPDLAISATISGGSSAYLEFQGTGITALTGVNTYSGATFVNAGTLVLSGSGTDRYTSDMLVSGTLELDNGSAGNVNNRLGSSVYLELDGGTFSYIGAPGIASSETINAMDTATGDGLMESTVSSTAGSSVTITVASIRDQFSPAAAGLHFQGIGANLGSATNQIYFSSQPALIGGILPFAVMDDSSGVDFATYGATGIAPLGNYATSLSGAGPSTNVKLSAGATLTGGLTVNAILFASPGANLNLAGNQLTVASGAIATAAAGDQITTGSLSLGSQGYLDTEPGDTLAISSSVASSGLAKLGGGTLTLSGTNTYTGGTYIDAGLLNVQNSSGLGNGANGTTVYAGTALQMQGNIAISGQTLYLYGSGENNSGALQNVSGNNTWAGAVSLNANTIDVTSGQLTLSGQIGGVGGMTEVGSGILQQSGSAANTYTGATTIGSGTLELNKTGAAAIPGSLVIGNGVGGLGAAQVVMMQASQFASTASVTVNNTGSFDLAGFSQSLTSLTINDGLVTNSGSGGTLTLSGASPLTFSGGTLNTGTGTLSLSTAGTITANAADQAVISGNLSLPTGTTVVSVSDGTALDDFVINATITGSGGISKSGAGTMLLSGNNNYSGGTSTSAGTLALGNANALGSNTLTISGGTLRADGGNLSIGNPVTVSGAITVGGRRDTSGINTGIDLTGAVNEIGSTTITVDDPSVLAEIANSIWGPGDSLTKAGDGTLILAGTGSTYTGGTVVTAGILNIQSSSALGGGAVSVSSGAALQLQGTLSIGNLPLTLGGSGFVGNIFGTGEGTGAIENVSGTSTWGTGTTAITIGSATSLGSDTGSLTLNGTLNAVVNGVGQPVNKVGLGTLQLAGTAANSLTGTMTVNDGSLQLNKTSGRDAIEGTLIIGDNQGTGTDTVQELTANQVLASTAVTVAVNSTGLWDLSAIPQVDLSSAWQTVTISGSPVGGTFTLSYNGQTTAAIAYNAPANSGTGNVQSALAALTNIGSGNVSVSGNAGGPYLVTFTGALANTDISQMTATASFSGGSSPMVSVLGTATGGVGQVLIGPTAGTSNTTVLTLEIGQTSSASITTGSTILAFAGLNGLTGLSSGGVQVTAQPAITAASPATISGNLALSYGGAATRTFVVSDSPAANDLVISANLLDGLQPGNLTFQDTGLARVVLSGNNSYSGSTTVSSGELNVQSNTALGATVTSAVQNVNYSATGGTLTITFNGQTTAAIAYNASASTVQGALASLSNIGAGNVAVAGQGGNYNILFQGSLAGVAEAAVTVGNSLLGASVPVVSVIVSGGGGTVVSSGASLELSGGVTIAGEQLSLAGAGPVNSASTAAGAANAGYGGLRSVSGSNTWSGPISLSTTTNSIGVDAGQLTLSGIISGIGSTVAKVGAGPLVYSGTLANTYTGNTYVNAGTLVVDKSAGAAIAGSVLVGNNLGGTDADVLQYGVGATTTEVSGTIIVESSGELDLATNNDSAGNTLVTVTGPTSSADVAAGSGGYTGYLITNIALAGTSASSPAAVISGTMPVSVVRTITVDRSGATDDLNISAVIISGSVVKSGWGTLDLSNTNSDGGTTLNANSGTVVVLADGALGAAATVTTVNAGSTLAFRGGVTYATSESIVVNGSGVTATGAATRNGAIDNLGGANSFAGTITLASASAIGVTAGSLAVSGAIGGAFALTVYGFGTLVTTGGITTSSTTVNNATLAGTGSDTGPVTLVTAGTLAPGTGSTPGILNTGSLTLNASGAFSVVLDGSTAGSGYSQNNVSGVVNLNGATLEASLGFVPAAGASFTILTSTTPVFGTFNNLPQGTIASIGGIGFTVQYNDGGDNVMLIANSAPTLSGTASLPTILKNATNPTGISVSALIAGGLSITDANSGAMQGIAVDGANNANGTWQFSLDGGGTWTAFGSPTDTSAVLLAANAGTLVRFVPSAGYSGTVSGGLTFRAWDQTSGVNGGTADASNNGASTPFSSATASASILVDAAPVVVGAYVSGSAWSASYLSMLAAAGVGNSAMGFELAGGANQLTTIVPWTNVTQISIAFSEPVTLGQASLTLYNSANAAISSSNYSYNSSTFVATWQFSTPLAANKYVLNLAANSVSDTAGMALDGAWTTGVSTFGDGSGNGTPGGDFNFYFDVVPGDANNSGSVTNGDVLDSKLQVGAVANSSNYLDDVNGAANITNSDVLLEKLQVGSNINAFPTPQLPPQSAPAAAPGDATPDDVPADDVTFDSSGNSVVVIAPAAGFVLPTLVPAAMVTSTVDAGLSLASGSSGDDSSADNAGFAAPTAQPAPAAAVSSTTITPASSTPMAATSTSLSPLVSPTSTIVVLAIPVSLPADPVSTDLAPAASPVADVLFQSLAESTAPAASALEPSDALILALESLGQTPSRAAFTPLDDVADNAAPTTLPPAVTSAAWTPATPLALDEVFSAAGRSGPHFASIDPAVMMITVADWEIADAAWAGIGRLWS